MKSKCIFLAVTLYASTLLAQVNALESKSLERIVRDYANKVESNYQDAVQEYARLPGSINGRLLGSDDALDLSPDYRSNPAIAEALRSTAQEFINRRYEEKLKDKPDSNEYVVFSGGGTGSGKTSNLLILEPALKGRAQIIYDTTMSHSNSAKKLIDQALDSGRSAAIIYVYRDPYEAFVDGVLPRAKKTGRSVGCPYHLASHLGSRVTMDFLVKQYSNDARFRLIVVDVSRGWDDRRLVQLSSLPYANPKTLSKKINLAIIEAQRAHFLNENTLQSTSLCRLD